jgi:hypothetical protein
MGVVTGERQLATERATEIDSPERASASGVPRRRRRSTASPTPPSPPRGRRPSAAPSPRA